MGLFDDMSGGEEKTVTKEIAYAGILMLADYSDGSVSQEEVRAFGNTICRMKLYRNMSEQQLNRVIDQGTGIIKRKGFDEALKTFAQALPESLHKAAFANACNQILADGVVEDEEKEFINNLRRALGLSGDDAQMIAQVIVWKNQG
jgi:tellurite resistance protein